ncbi:MAG: LpqB family beta-propeller domain-containing protein [Beutenbergiaceae bacterium]
MRHFHLVVLLALSAVLSGCLSLPDTGGVQPGVDAAPADDGLDLVAADPAQDASQEEIVRGFLFAAAAGLADDFETARRFLTNTGGQEWDPGDGVTIYADADALSYRSHLDDPRLVTVTAQVAATVDAQGTFTEAAPGTVREFTFELEQSSDDQWRINTLDDGVLVSWVTFGSQYRQMSVYFLSTDAAHRLIPEVRWVPRSGSENAAVRGLLAGPAQWLAGGAVTAVPDGTNLALDAVTIADGIATVALSRQILDASAADRALVLEQLTATLVQLPQIRLVQMSVDGSVLGVDEDAGLVPVPIPARNPTLVSGAGLSVLNGEALEPVPDLVVPEGLTALALRYTDELPVGVVGPQLVTLAGSGEPNPVLYQGDGEILPPTIDVQGWVWTGPRSPEPIPGSLVAIGPDGDQVQVQAPHLADLEVVDIRVSLEGARLAYVVRGELDTLFVSSVERNPDGQPVAIGPGVAVGAPMAQVLDLVWVNDVELGVLGALEEVVTVHLVGVGGATVPLPSIDNAVSIASGDGPRQLYLTTVDGELFGRSGNGWRVVVGGVQLPTFAG